MENNLDALRADQPSVSSLNSIHNTEDLANWIASLPPLEEYGVRASHFETPLNGSIQDARERLTQVLSGSSFLVACEQSNKPTQPRLRLVNNTVASLITNGERQR